MIKSTAIVLILFALTAGVSAWASDRACRDVLTLEFLEEDFSELPVIQSTLSELLSDSAAPQFLKNRLYAVLSDKRVVMRRITPVLGKEWTMPNDVAGFASSYYYPITTVSFEEHAPTWNSEDGYGPKKTPKEIKNKGKLAPAFLIALESEAVSPGQAVTDSSSALHELTHVRVYMFFLENFERLSKVIPSEFLGTDEDGTKYVAEQFIDFVHERITVETEFLYLNHARKSFGSDWVSPSEDLKTEWFDLPMPEVRRRIAARVIKQYKITDPAVIRLSHYSVAEILRGVPWKPNHPRNGYFRSTVAQWKDQWLRWRMGN